MVVRMGMNTNGDAALPHLRGEDNITSSTDNCYDSQGYYPVGHRNEKAAS